MESRNYFNNVANEVRELIKEQEKELRHGYRTYAHYKQVALEHREKMSQAMTNNNKVLFEKSFIKEKDRIESTKITIYERFRKTQSKLDVYADDCKEGNIENKDICDKISNYLKNFDPQKIISTNSENILRKAYPNINEKNFKLPTVFQIIKFLEGGKIRKNAREKPNVKNAKNLATMENVENRKKRMNEYTRPKKPRAKSPRKPRAKSPRKPRAKGPKKPRAKSPSKSNNELNKKSRATTPSRTQTLSKMNNWAKSYNEEEWLKDLEKKLNKPKSNSRPSGKT